MNVGLSEIWRFLELCKDQKISRIDLVLGSHIVEDVTEVVIQQIHSGEEYDTELLPDLFTNSEITWQPNEYASHKDCLAGINILQHECGVKIEQYLSTKSVIGNFYAEVIRKLELETKSALEQLNVENVKLSRVLGKFRRNVYPIIKFILEHPANHPQIKFEAVLRQDFMAKTLFNEYHVKFSELVEPKWKIWLNEEAPKKEVTKEKMTKEPVSEES